MKTAIAILMLSVATVFAAQHTNGNYIVLLNDGYDPDTVANSQGVGVQKKWTAAIHGFRSTLNGNQADKLAQDVRVKSIEPDIAVYATNNAVTIGQAQWVKTAIATLGGGYTAENWCVVSDSSDNVIIAGDFNGQVNFGNGAISTAGSQSVANTDAFVAKYTKQGILIWARTFGGPAADSAKSVVVDSQGNIIVAGYFANTVNFGGISATAPDPFSVQAKDMFVAKYAPGSAGVPGDLIWLRTFGGGNTDLGAGVCVDRSDNVLFAGLLNSTGADFGSGITLSATRQNLAIVKMNSSGTTIWATLYGGTTGSVIPNALALDNATNLIVAGKFSGTVNLGGTNLPAASNFGSFIGKYSYTNGAHVWSRGFGNSSSDTANGVTSDPLTGNSIVTGGYTSTGSTDFGGGPIAAGSGGIYMVGYSPTGTYLWALRYGTGGDGTSDWGGAVKIDALGHLVLTGFKGSFWGFPTGSLGGGAFILSYSISGNTAPTMVWYAQPSGSGATWGYAITFDAIGQNLFTAGRFIGEVDFGSGITISASAYSAFVMERLNLTNSPNTQVIPTGIRRIGTLSNPYAHIGSGNTNRVNVDVAVIDSGIDLTHPDLNVFTNVTFVTGTVNGNDDLGHGSHVSGIIGALDNSFGVVGVAPGARLWAVKVLDSTGQGDLSQVISGINWCVQRVSQIEVINMSLGVQAASPALRAACQAAVNAGIVVVVAAGNSAFDLFLGGEDNYQNTIPAAYPEVMTVTALCDTDGLSGGLGAPGPSNYGLDDTRANFSNFSSIYSGVAADNPVSSPGGMVDLAAPGVAIYSTFKDGGYSTQSGTSMASPHAAGAVALYIAQYGRATNAAQVYGIRQAIINCAAPMSSWGFNPPNPVTYSYSEPLLTVDHFGSPLKYPTVKITSPVNNSSSTTNSPISFAGSAIDPTDGNKSTNLLWTSSIQGVLFQGASTNMTLAAGSHIIRAAWTNSLGLAGSDAIGLTITVPVIHPAPTLAIDSPTNSASFTNGTAILFSGRVTSSFECQQLTWSDNIDGPFAVGSGFGSTNSTVLSPGSHVVTFSGTDFSGYSGSTNVAFTVAGTPPPATNYPPTVTITQPPGRSSIPQGTVQIFAGAANDLEDGNLSSLIRWNDSVAGLIGTGGAISNTPSIGLHTVTASVQDSKGSIATASVLLNVYSTNANTAPVVVVTSPTNNTPGTTGISQKFTCTANDAEQGPMTNVVWFDSLGGIIGLGLSATNTPQIKGTHDVTASCTDSNRAISVSHVLWIVGGTNNPLAPVVTITGAATNLDNSLSYTANALDFQDGDISSVIQWFSSAIGYVGIGPTVTVDQLAGINSLLAKATDSLGLYGVAVVGQTNSATFPTLSVSVTASPKTVFLKEKVALTASVTSSGTPISGATCQFSVLGASGRVFTQTVLTDSTGAATWNFQAVQQAGLGIATCTVNASKTDYTAGQGTTDFTVSKNRIRTVSMRSK